MDRKVALPAGAALLYGGLTYWRLRLMANNPADGRSVGPEWLHQLTSAFMKYAANFNGVKIISETSDATEIDTPGGALYVWHPHGFMAYTPCFLFAEQALGGKPHGFEWFGTCIPVLLKIPVLGEIMQWNNARSVDEKTIDKILAQGKGVAIQPGGVKEQAASRHDQEQAFFPSKLGFVRMAIKHGVPLVPLYNFGENQLYKRVGGMEWLTKFIAKVSGLTMPILTAKGGLPMGLFFPRATDVHIRWGKPVEVGAADPDPSEERVQEVFSRYVAELKRIFDTHAHDCLPKAVADKGLKIILSENSKPVPVSRL